MKPVIYRNIRRPDPEVMKLLRDLGVATVHEAQGRSGLMKPYMRPIYASAKIGAPAVTVSCQPGDNLMIHAAVEVCQPGDVLVVTTTAESTDGMFGELLASSLRVRGVAGLIIDAGVRDVADLTAMEFPGVVEGDFGAGHGEGDGGFGECAGGVRGRDRSSRRCDCGAMSTAWWWCRAREAAEVAKLSDQRRIKEEKNRERLKAGELGLDMYGLRAKLKELGVEFLDEAPDS